MLIIVRKLVEKFGRFTRERRESGMWPGSQLFPDFKETHKDYLLHGIPKMLKSFCLWLNLTNLPKSVIFLIFAPRKDYKST